MNVRTIVSSAASAAALLVGLPSGANATVTLRVWKIINQPDGQTVDTLFDLSHPVISSFSHDEDNSNPLFIDIVHLYGNVFHKLVDAKIDVTSGVPSTAQGVNLAPPQHYEMYAATQDILTITSSVYSGPAHGVLWMILSGTVIADVSGLAPINVDLQGTAFASLEVKVNGAVEVSEEAHANALQSDGAVNFKQLVAVDFSFVFGEPFELTMEVSAEAEIITEYLNVLPTSEARLHAVADFSEFGGPRLAWVGLSDIVTEGGDLVTDYEVTSESGTDYTLPSAVPVQQETVGGLKQRFLDR